MDVKKITEALTVAERLRNNLVIILGAIGSVVLLVSGAVGDLDFSSPQLLWAGIPALMAKLGSLQAYGPVTVKKLRESREIK